MLQEAKYRFKLQLFGHSWPSKPQSRMQLAMMSSIQSWERTLPQRHDWNSEWRNGHEWTGNGWEWNPLWNKKESHSTNELPGMKKHRAGGVDLVGRLFNCQHFSPKYFLCIPACEMKTSAIKLKSNLSTLHPYHTQKRPCIQTRCDTCKINPRVYPYKHWDEESLLKNG